MIARFSSKRAVQAVSAVIAGLVFVYLGWAIGQISQQPDVGALWWPDGEVYYASPTSEFRAGDVILAVDGVDWLKSHFPYGNWQQGDNVHFTIRRNEAIQTLPVHLVQSPPFIVLLTHSLVVLVAFVFWLSGTYVVFVSPAQIQQGVLLFLFCQLMSIILAGGNIVTVSWLSSFLLMLTWWAAALSIHLHLSFPINRLATRTPAWIGIVYVMPLLGLSRFLHISGVSRAPDIGGPPALDIWLLVTSALVLALLANAYRSTLSPLTKRQIGLVVVSGLVALVPLGALTLLPKVLTGRPVIPIEFSLIFLVAVPMGYGYAIARFQFIKLDRYISRTAALLIVVGMVGMLYWILTAGLREITPAQWLANPFFDLIIIMGLALTFDPLRRYLQRWADNLLYGGWYDYSTVVGEISHSLDEAGGLPELADTFSQGIQKTMRVKWACLIVPGDSRGVSVIRVAGEAEDPELLAELRLAAMPHVTHYMGRAIWPKTHREMQQALAKSEDLTPVEQKLLRNSGLRLWVPLPGHREALGILLLGPKYGGDIFDSADMQILAVVSRQASMAFRNVQLIHQLEEKAQESEQYKKEIIRTREGERKRIALELHDQVIQALVGLKYQLANLQNQPKPNPNGQDRVVEVQEGIGDLIQTTRTLCQDLRPPALDLGLVPGIRSLISAFEKQADLPVSLIVEGDRTIPMTEDIAICAYRCTSEALQNIYRHAQATQVTVRLTLAPTEMTLSIDDNGRGFVLPERLGSLMEDNHFGLVGMRERIELVDGAFVVTSRLNHGTHLEARIPLAQAMANPPERAAS